MANQKLEGKSQRKGSGSRHPQPATDHRLNSLRRCVNA